MCLPISTPVRQDLGELLAGEGVDCSVPAEVGAASGVDPAGYERCLPLHAFDNSDFEIRSPEQWRELVEEAKAGGWPVQSPPPVV
jgi:hypothetical protein